MRKPRILVVGSFVMDLITTTRVFPASGETVLGESFANAPAAREPIRLCRPPALAQM